MNSDLLSLLRSNFREAREILKGHRFADLTKPKIAHAFAQMASIDDILAAISGTDDPGAILRVLASFLSPGQLAELAADFHLLSPDVQSKGAADMAGALSSVNLDAAVQFAKSLDGTDLQSKSFAGIIDNLRDRAFNLADITSLYNALPQTLQNSDAVLFAYGNALGANDASAALQALSQINSPQERNLALVAFANNIASTAPEVALSAIYSSSLTSQGMQNHGSQIVATWAAFDQAGLSNYLNSTTVIPPGDLQMYQNQLKQGH